MLTTPDARKTGKIFKRCVVCKAEKYMLVEQRVCDRCSANEPLKMSKQARHLIKPKPKPKRVKRTPEYKPFRKRDTLKKFWIVGVCKK